VNNNAHSRAVLRVATAYGAARLHQQASPSHLLPTPLTGFSCERRAVKFKRNKSDRVFQLYKPNHIPSQLFPPFPIGKIL
jgi:hypothetical protein